MSISDLLRRIRYFVPAKVVGELAAGSTAAAEGLARGIRHVDTVGMPPSLEFGRSGPTLAWIMDREAAVFRVLGAGPVGSRSIEPVTSLARRIAADPDLMRRARAALGSLDDLTGDVNLTRAVFATTSRATAGAQLLSELRRVPDEALTVQGMLDAVLEGSARNAATYTHSTGLYQHGMDQLVFSNRVTRELLGGWVPTVVEPTLALSGAYAARIAPHELFHGVGSWSRTGSRSIVDRGVREATASIVGTLRASETLRAVRGTSTGPELDAFDLFSNYNEFSKVITGLARMGGHDLSTPAAAAALERHFAGASPVRLLHELAYDAAKRTGGSMRVIRDAAADGLRTASSDRFLDSLGRVGIARPDTSLAWMFEEGMRRGGAVASGNPADPAWVKAILEAIPG